METMLVNSCAESARVVGFNLNSSATNLLICQPEQVLMTLSSGW